MTSQIPLHFQPLASNHLTHSSNAHFSTNILLNILFHSNQNALNISITFYSDLIASINSILRHTVLLCVKLSNRISCMFKLTCKSEILSVRLNVWSALVDQTVIFISGYPSRSANGFLTAVIFSCAITSLSFTDSEHESF